MGGDYTRFTFDPRDNHSGVLMQQGRVQLDADWNELVEIVGRRLRAETIDIIGRAVVPRETPDGFLIEASGGTFTIGPGRMYVDGLLAENHGTGEPAFDPVLEEMSTPDPVPYTAQPWLPNPPALPTGGGPHVVYVDLWQREVTWLEDPDVIEKAVGVDTTTRLQTVWQVRLHALDARTVTCATPDGEIPGWSELTRPSDGRLTTGAVGVPDSEDPCYLQPTGGFRGQENRLYRVEIHQGGAPGIATFKWSRDNGAVASAVTAVSADRRVLTVTRTGRDGVLRFDQGDWVEITDDWRELAGEPGVMALVADVDDTEATITLETALPAGAFPTSGIDNLTDPDRHTRVRRWDQSETLRDVDGNEVAPVDATTGVLTVPAAATELVLEDGVSIEFGIAAAGGRFRVGDYWVFAARTIDASVEELDEAAPRGIHHHYARLAMVTFPGTESDCRELWPPELGGDGCDCDRCVSPESHASGELTIQRAIDEVKDTGGKVCLAPGIYDLGDTPLRITRGRSLRLIGKGWQTLLIGGGEGPAIVVENSTNVTIEELAVVTTTLPGEDRAKLDDAAAQSGAHMLALLLAITARTPAGPPIFLRNSIDTTVRRCMLAQGGFRSTSTPAIALGGFLFITTLRDNLMLAGSGIATIGGEAKLTTALVDNQGYLLSAGLAIADNYIAATRVGVGLTGFSLHAGDTRIERNTIIGCSIAGIAATGVVLSSDMLPQSDTSGSPAGEFAVGSRMDIASNLIAVRATGIVAGTDDVRVRDNDISAMGDEQEGPGILLRSGLDKSGIDRAIVVGNRVSRMSGAGIAIEGTIRSALIKMNVLQSTGAGIVMDEDAEAGDLAIDNNQLLDLAPNGEKITGEVVGIRIVSVERAMIVGNAISGLGLEAAQAEARAGIQAALCRSVRIAGNELVDVGPREGFLRGSVGIDVIGPFARVDVSDNAVRRSGGEAPQEDGSQWVALAIRTGASKTESIGRIVMTRAADTTDPTTGRRTTGSVLAIFAGKVVLLPTLAEAVGVRGNLLEGYGARSQARMLSTGPCTFSDNRCFHLAGARVPVVQLSAGAIIASANYLQGLDDVSGLSLVVPDAGAFTVLGNIVSGSVELNNAPLPAPWSALNVIGS